MGGKTHLAFRQIGTGGCLSRSFQTHFGSWTGIPLNPVHGSHGGWSQVVILPGQACTLPGVLHFAWKPGFYSFICRGMFTLPNHVIPIRFPMNHPYITWTAHPWHAVTRQKTWLRLIWLGHGELRQLHKLQWQHIVSLVGNHCRGRQSAGCRWMRHSGNWGCGAGLSERTFRLPVSLLVTYSACGVHDSILQAAARAIGPLSLAFATAFALKPFSLRVPTGIPRDRPKPSELWFVSKATSSILICCVCRCKGTVLLHQFYCRWFKISYQRSIRITFTEQTIQDFVFSHLIRCC